MSTASLADPCTPSLYMGFAGSDVDHRTFQSGYQISRADAFSLVHYYQLAATKVRWMLSVLAAQSVSSLAASVTAFASCFVVGSQLGQLYNNISSGGIGANSGGLGGGDVTIGDGTAA